MKHTISTLLLALLVVACCKEDQPAPPDDTNVPGLPPATQNGANTLGFLLNGKPWTPEGPNNLSIDYDPGIDNGIFSVVAHRKVLSADNDYFLIGVRDSINFIRTPQAYIISPQRLAASIFDDRFFCSRNSEDTSMFSQGWLKIDKLHRNQRVIAGTFEVTLFNPQCGDTIRITKGRFDLKF